MNKRLFQCLGQFILGLMLLSCAAGGGETGTGQDTVTEGVITGFGSVLINGVKYETNTDTTVTLDSEVLTERSLKVGMIVTLSGRINDDGVTGSASSITFDENVEGVVTENTFATNNQLVVLGQIVEIDRFDTIFASSVVGISAFDAITLNSLVEVSGHTAGDGKIYATRIDVKKGQRLLTDEMALKGIVASLTDTTFKVGNLLVNYSSAELRAFGADTLTNGDYVKLKGQLASNDNNTLFASQVSLKPQHKSVSDIGRTTDLAIEGRVTSRLLNGKFKMNGRVVIITDLTQVEPNMLAISPGKRVKVEGRLNSSNQLLAKHIDVQTKFKTKIEGVISALNVALRSITVFGEDILIRNETRLKDDRDDDNISVENRHFFNFKDLVINQYVEVAYFVNKDGNKIALKLELKETEEESQEWEIDGEITAYNADDRTLVLAGHMIDVSAIDLTLNDTLIGQEGEAQGEFVDNAWLADEFELKEAESSAEELIEEDD